MFQNSPQVNSPQEHLVSAVGCVIDLVRTRDIFLTGSYHSSRWAEPGISSQKVYIQIYCLQGDVVQLRLPVKAAHVPNGVKSYISPIVLIINKLLYSFPKTFYVPTQCFAVDALMLHTQTLTHPHFTTEQIHTNNGAWRKPKAPPQQQFRCLWAMLSHFATRSHSKLVNYRPLNWNVKTSASWLIVGSN